MAKTNGYTLYERSSRIYTPAGTGWEDEYAYEINDAGRKVLVKVGEKNLYQEIQSHAEECKIENILKRVAIGDYTDFRPNGIYADATKLPTNLIDARKAINKLENTWNNLPSEIKNKYNNSVEEFIAKAGSESWLIDMGFKKNVTIDDIKPETEPEIPKPAPNVEE